MTNCIGNLALEVREVGNNKLRVPIHNWMLFRQGQNVIDSITVRLAQMLGNLNDAQCGRTG